MEVFKANLHIHSVLSPCGDIVMTPLNIIKRAVEVGLDIIAIADHNSAKNVEIAMKLSQDYDLTIIPAMEVESKGEVHLLCLFSKLEDLLDWQEIVYQNLPQLENNEDYFGPQLITDESDDFKEREKRLLLTAVNLSLEEIVEQVTEKNGLVIPAHIDKSTNSILANLGFIPPELNISTVEIADKKNLAKIRKKIGEEYSIINNSDAHYLKDIKVKIEFKLEEANLNEVALALKGEKNRTFRLK